MIDAHIVDGDYVVVQKEQTVENGEMAVVLVDGEATLKYFSKEKKRNHFISRSSQDETDQRSTGSIGSGFGKSGRRIKDGGCRQSKKKEQVSHRFRII
ncbi:MAG: hypothetical protein MPW15_11615 [Candidatus Manganitrophus sp.]|nr:hypothetical protein [Candidatus Manganitrophus sp.]